MLYWENDNLHVITDDGKHFVYKNARIVEYKQELENNETIKAEKVEIANAHTILLRK